MGVKIAAKFTKNNKLYNGLDSVEDDLVKDPNLVRTAVVTYILKYGNTDYENGGAVTNTIKIVEFEPLSDEAAVAAKTLQREAFAKRTGHPMQDDLFSSVEPDLDDEE